MNDRTLVMVMVNGIGAHLTSDEKRADLTDLKRGRLIDQVCVSGHFAAGKMITASCIRTAPVVHAPLQLSEAKRAPILHRSSD